MGHRPRLNRRSYGQREPVAAALDLLGDRWTLLVIRELVLGPRRWTDLLANLGGIGKNLLADRLRDLQESGLVTAEGLPWSSSKTTLYRLTESGARLEPMLIDLARFGLLRMPSSGQSRPEWAAFALAASLDPDEAALLHAEIDGSPFTIRTGDGKVQVRSGTQGVATKQVQGKSDELAAVSVTR